MTLALLSFGRLVQNLEPHGHHDGSAKSGIQLSTSGPAILMCLNWRHLNDIPTYKTRHSQPRGVEL